MARCLDARDPLCCLGQGPSSVRSASCAVRLRSGSRGCPPLPVGTSAGRGWRHAGEHRASVSAREKAREGGCTTVGMALRGSFDSWRSSNFQLRSSTVYVSSSCPTYVRAFGFARVPGGLYFGTLFRYALFRLLLPSRRPRRWRGPPTRPCCRRGRRQESNRWAPQSRVPPRASVCDFTGSWTKSSGL